MCVSVCVCVSLCACVCAGVCACVCVRVRDVRAFVYFFAYARVRACVCA